MKETSKNSIDTTLYNEKSLYLLNIRELRDMGRKFGVPSPTTLKKQDLIEYILKIVYGEAAPQRSNYGRPNVREFEVDKCLNKIKKNADLTDELLRLKLEDYMPLDLKVAMPKEKQIADNIMTLVFIEEDEKCMLKKHAFVSSAHDIEIEKSLAESLNLADYDVIEARVEGELFKIITINGNRRNDKFKDFVISETLLEAGKQKVFDVESLEEKETIINEIQNECKARDLKLVVFANKKGTDWCTECVEYNLDEDSSLTYKNFMKFMGECEKLIFKGEDIVVLIEDASVVDNILDSFDDDVNERAKTNVRNSFNKILALENLVIAFRNTEIKEF